MDEIILLPVEVSRGEAPSEPQIVFTTKQAKTIYHALTLYHEKIRNDLETRFGGNREYCLEDDMFLGEELSKTAYLLFTLDDKYKITEL